ncbi:MAG: pyrimidine 5'-nucleotidase [Pseudomonadota bacterium]
MISEQFSHVDTWVFDLDNTLYNPSVRLFDQIEDRMRQYIVSRLKVTAAEADTLRATYWEHYGTTLAGLLANHQIDPMEFLYDVHDISFAGLAANPELAARIRALPGRKIVYTNGDERYARQVLGALALEQEFDAVFGIEHADFAPKPQRAAFQQVFAQADILGARAAMFEDVERNLEVPHALGMRTVLVHGTSQAEHVHHDTDDLTGFLSHIS